MNSSISQFNIIQHRIRLYSYLKSRFLLPISSRQIDELISIADFFPPNGWNSFFNLLQSIYLLLSSTSISSIRCHQDTMVTDRRIG
jgi:hypothetical protein